MTPIPRPGRRFRPKRHFLFTVLVLLLGACGPETGFLAGELYWPDAEQETGDPGLGPAAWNIAHIRFELTGPAAIREQVLFSAGAWQQSELPVGRYQLAATALDARETPRYRAVTSVHIEAGKRHLVQLDMQALATTGTTP